ncbi:MAG: phage regulatory CII family protein, partial [Shewanella sp.]
MSITITVNDPALNGDEAIEPTKNPAVVALLASISDLVQQYPGGAPALAARVGMSPNTLQHRANPNNPHHRMSADDLMVLMRATNNIAPLQVIAAELGYICVRHTPSAPSSPLDAVAYLIDSVSELVRSVRDAQMGERA